MIPPAAVGCKPMFGGDISEVGTLPAARVPQRKHLNGIIDQPVVQVVPNPGQGDTTNVGQSRTRGFRAHRGLSEEKAKDSVQVLDDGVRRG